MFGTDLSVLWKKEQLKKERCPLSTARQTGEGLLRYNRCIANIETNYRKAAKDALVIGGVGVGVFLLWKVLR